LYQEISDIVNHLNGNRIYNINYHFTLVSLIIKKFRNGTRKEIGNWSNRLR